MRNQEKKSEAQLPYGGGSEQLVQPNVRHGWIHVEKLGEISCRALPLAFFQHRQTKTASGFAEWLHRVLHKRPRHQQTANC